MEDMPHDRIPYYFEARFVGTFSALANLNVRQRGCLRGRLTAQVDSLLLAITQYGNTVEDHRQASLAS